jgi:hypothetical protein
MSDAPHDPTWFNCVAKTKAAFKRLSHAEWVAHWQCVYSREERVLRPDRMTPEDTAILKERARCSDGDGRAYLFTLNA